MLSRGASVGGRVVLPDGTPAAQSTSTFDSTGRWLAWGPQRRARPLRARGHRRGGTPRHHGFGRGRSRHGREEDRRGGPRRAPGRRAPGALDLGSAPARSRAAGPVVTAEGSAARLQRGAWRLRRRLLDVGRDRSSVSSRTGPAPSGPPGSEGKWKVQASAKGWSSSPWQPVNLPLPEGAPPLMITLERGAGRTCVDPDGNPVVGATVRPALEGEGHPTAQGLTETQEARSIEDGASRSADSRPGRSPSSRITLIGSSEAVARRALGPDVLQPRVGGDLTGLVYGGGRPPPAPGDHHEHVELHARHAPHGADGTLPARRDQARHASDGNARAGNGRAVQRQDEGREGCELLLLLRACAPTSRRSEARAHLVLGAPPADPVKVTGVVLRRRAGGECARPPSAGTGSMKFMTTDADGKLSSLDHPGASDVGQIMATGPWSGHAGVPAGHPETSARAQDRAPTGHLGPRARRRRKACAGCARHAVGRRRRRARILPGRALRRDAHRRGRTHLLNYMNAGTTGRPRAAPSAAAASG